MCYKMFRPYLPHMLHGQLTSTGKNVEFRITKINLPSTSAISFKHLSNNVLGTYLKPHCTTLDRVITDTHRVMSEKCTNIHGANETQHIQHKADNKVQLISHQHHSWHPVCWPMEW